MNDEQTLALTFAPAARRGPLKTLWDLDEALGKIVATTTEPIIGQMRLTWWHERLCAIDAGERAAEPLLQALAREMPLVGITGAELAVLIEGWEALLEPLPLDQASLALFAEHRGGAFFRLSAKLLHGEVDIADGMGWALVDFARHCADFETSERAAALARHHFAAGRMKAPKPLRILGRLAAARLGRAQTKIRDPLPRFVFLRAVLG